MAAPSMTRRSRKYFKKIQRAKTKYELQSIASTIQSDLDRRNLSYDEALNLGNFIQNRADQLPGTSIVYAVSDRDAYRRTLELYLRDALLTRTEQLLLWEERAGGLEFRTKSTIVFSINCLRYGSRKVSL